MNVSELRAFLKERRIKGYSTLKKGKLEEKVKKLKEQENAEKYEQNLRETALCSACLREQRVQRKIDDKTHDQRLLESTIRILICDFCQHTEFVVDGDHTVCVDCGLLQGPDAEGVGRYRQ